MANDKILLRKSDIDGAAAKLSALAESVNTRRLHVDLGKSTGAFADATIQYVDELKNLGGALALLYYNTALALNRIADEFYGIDDAVANVIGSGNGDH